MLLLLLPGLAWANTGSIFRKTEDGSWRYEQATKPSDQQYFIRAMVVPPNIARRMRGSTWHPGCPVPIKDLAYVRVAYWGFDRKVHTGELIVNRLVIKDIAAIFKKLYQQHFPIESMRLIDGLDKKTRARIAKINTIAFNCRKRISSSGKYSHHSYGGAIDINPRQNPYVKGSRIIPPAGKAFLNRSHYRMGMILKNGDIYKDFIQRGWSWGGDWRYSKDYMHFERKDIAKRYW